MAKPACETERSEVEVHKAQCHCVSSSKVLYGEACVRDRAKRSRGTQGSMPLCRKGIK